MKTETSVERIDAFFRNDVARFTEGLAALDAAIDPTAAPQQDDRYDQLLELLGEIRETCRRLEAEVAEDYETIKSAQRRFREAIALWFDRSRLMHHAKSKPRGYPGDYQMLTAIYDGKPLSSGIGGYLDLFFLGTELGRAVPARMAAVREFLYEQISRRPTESAILNVACGPCQEYAHGFPLLQARGTSVTCVDFDTEALAFSQDTVVGSRNDLPEFRFVRYNALRMRAAKPFIERHGRFDIIYSVGLCDYIPDQPLIGMLRGWREMLKPEGVLYVAFKDSERYDEIDYQWLVDWYFYQRTEAECRSLFLQAGWQADEMEMRRDATEIIMNFAAQADGSSLRVDAAHLALEQQALPLPIPAE